MRVIVAVLVLLSVVLTGCVQEKPVYDNPGFDEIDAYLNQTDIETTIEPVNNESMPSDPTPTEEIKGSKWYSKYSENGVVKAIVGFFDTIVKGLFGENGWYYVGAAVVLLIAFAMFKTVGLVIVFLILMFIFTQVIGK